MNLISNKIKGAGGITIIGNMCTAAVQCVDVGVYQAMSISPQPVYDRGTGRLC